MFTGKNEFQSRSATVPVVCDGWALDSRRYDMFDWVRGRESNPEFTT